MEMYLFLKFLVCLKIACALVDAQNDCWTPVKESGKCVPYTQCQLHADLYKNFKSMKHKMKQYIQESFCRVKNNVHFVCCAPRHFIHHSSAVIDSSASDPSADKLPKKEPAGCAINIQGRSDFEDVIGHRALSLVNQYGCGKVSGNKVYNGEHASPGEFPWVVQLRYKTNRGMKIKCGGSLISKRYVLTAAHCVTKIKSHEVSARLGEYDTSRQVDCIGKYNCFPPVQDISIKDIIIHPEFGYSNFSNDIALLRLMRDAEINDENVLPICLPTTPELLSTNLRKVTIAGWGLTERGHASNILKKAAMSVISNEECQQLYKRVHRVTPRHICAGGGKKGSSCHGDSGNPLVSLKERPWTRYIQYGIVSAGRCGEKDPGMHVRLAYFIKWILDQIRP